MSTKRNFKYCVICERKFYAPPSSKKVTCSEACSKANKSQKHIGVSNKWNAESKQRLSALGKTPNLEHGTLFAQKGPKSGRFETNVNAKNWHLVSPNGKHYHFHSLNHWLRQNCLELFGCEPDSREFANIRSGLSGAKRAVLGKNYGSCTYKGWQAFPTDDDE